MQKINIYIRNVTHGNILNHNTYIYAWNLSILFRPRFAKWEDAIIF